MTAPVRAATDVRIVKRVRTVVVATSTIRAAVNATKVSVPSGPVATRNRLANKMTEIIRKRARQRAIDARGNLEIDLFFQD